MDGKEITGQRPNQRNIGMVFQSYALFPNMTVADNIGFGLSVGGVDKAEIKQRIEEMLALIKLEQLGGRYPYQLSGGQQQRVALARALQFAPSCCCLTSRFRRSTPRSACRCATKFGRFSANWALPPSM
jgi:putative spermidine/putrescine transport system ATP-binding protein